MIKQCSLIILISGALSLSKWMNRSVANEVYHQNLHPEWDASITGCREWMMFHILPSDASRLG